MAKGDFRDQLGSFVKGALQQLDSVREVVVQKSRAGRIQIDGSSTVFPITEAVAEDFQKTNKGVRVTVGISGTGGGFEKFCAGETDISDASRPISATEIEACKKAGIEYIELPIAYDGSMRKAIPY